MAVIFDTPPDVERAILPNAIIIIFVAYIAGSFKMDYIN